MKISVYIAVSANGLISNARNQPDWLSNEYGEGLYTMCEKFGAVIMGKTTYNILAPDYLPLKNKGTTVVLTTDSKAKSDNSSVVFTKDDPAAIVRTLSQRGHTTAVIIGGTMTVSAFVNAGLVDDIYLVMEPVLFGAGMPLLKGVESEIKLNLLEVSKLNDRTLRLHYALIK
jgi:dihydrofolate reductase